MLMRWAGPTVAVMLLTACSTAAPTAPPSTAVQPPRIADVTDYRGDLRRTGRMPGPAPSDPVRVRWRFTGPVPLTLPPAVVAGQVLVPGDGSLVALDLESGAVLWSVALGAQLNAAVTVASGTVYATTSDGVTHAVDLRSHQERWRFVGAADGAQVSIQDGTVYLGTRRRDLVALDPADGRTRWSVHVGHSVSRTTIADGMAYVGGEGTGTMTAIDLARQRVAWTFDTGADRLVTPVADDGTLFVAGVAAGALPGRGTSLFALDARTGTRKWSFAPPGDPPMSSFAVSAHDVYIGTDTTPGTLYAVAVGTGKVTWQQPVPGPVDRPTLVDDALYLASGQGGLLALDTGTGRRRWTAPVDGYAEGVVLTGGMALVAARDATDAPGTLTAFTS
ncbi:PQQ-binding-like beta-propeller repeat protein [Dactylosporangium cerinum]|uniref:PQQ-binding-like beta-propeller repeat protein n=1 Tax=Dactylosporangium cerinum TaxID=1434730 RepID=A0ABV9WEX8_9ACTN